MSKEFERFTKGKFALEIMQKGKIVFRSKREGVGGLLAFIRKNGRSHRDLIIFDKVIGRAAALLFAYLKAKEVYGAIGSRAAAKTLKKFRIKFCFKKTVTGILNKAKTGSCPMEKLSRAKTPAGLYAALVRR